MRLPLRLIAATSAVAMAITVVGCGGSDSASAPDGAAETVAAETTASGSDAEGNLAGFMKDIGAELNAYWASDWGPGWKDAVVKVPEESAGTACGTISAAGTGPAYCGADNTMVLPVAFFRDQIVGADEDLNNDAAVAAILAAGTAGIVALGSGEVAAGRITRGQLLVFLAYLAQLYEPLNQLSHLGGTISTAQASAQRVLEWLNTPDHSANGTTPPPPPPPRPRSRSGVLSSGLRLRTRPACPQRPPSQP